jgi:hypothetical protein
MSASSASEIDLQFVCHLIKVSLVVSSVVARSASHDRVFCWLAINH